MTAFSQLEKNPTRLNYIFIIALSNQQSINKVIGKFKHVQPLKYMCSFSKSFTKKYKTLAFKRKG